jgi:hypothetical protein
MMKRKREWRLDNCRVRYPSEVDLSIGLTLIEFRFAGE